jgi:hypothetical protein
MIRDYVYYTNLSILPITNIAVALRLDWWKRMELIDVSERTESLRRS